MAYEIELSNSYVTREVFVDTKDIDDAINVVKEEYPGWDILTVCEVV